MRNIGLKHETAEQTLKALPAIGGTAIAGLTLNEWVAVATLIYVVLQIGFLIWKWRQEAKAKS